MKAVKITRPMWIGEIGPQIASYVKKINYPNITYESLYNSLATMVQHGGDKAEVWAVIDDNKPLCFASWYVSSPPEISTAFWDHIYKWVSESEPVLLLADEFLEFAKRNRCEFMRCRANNKKVSGLFKKYAVDKNIDVEEINETVLFGRRS